MTASGIYFREVLQPAELDARQLRAERGETPRPQNLASEPVWRMDDGTWWREVDGVMVQIPPFPEEGRS